MQYAVDLINTYRVNTGDDAIGSLDGLSAFARHRTLELPDPGDLATLQEHRGALRAVFATEDLCEAVERVNDLLAVHNCAPRLVAEPGNLHVHFEPRALALGPYLAAITTVALMFTVCDYGIDRLGICADPTCQRAYIDTTKNGQKAYCSSTCAQRINVAAFRARRRHASTQSTSPNPPKKSQ